MVLALRTTASLRDVVSVSFFTISVSKRKLSSVYVMMDCGVSVFWMLTLLSVMGEGCLVTEIYFEDYLTASLTVSLPG